MYSIKNQFEDYELENKALVKLGAKILSEEKDDWKFDYYDFIDSAFDNFPIKGRFEFIPEKYLNKKRSKIGNIIMDMGHNPDGVAQTLQKLDQKGFNKIGVIFGSSKDKDFNTSLKILKKKTEIIYLVKSNHFPL